MTSFEIFNIIFSSLSICGSIIAILISLIPYRNKIVFKVSFNPFFDNINNVEDFEIKFLIINKSDRDLKIDTLGAEKGMGIQIFDEKDYPNTIEAYSSNTFIINNSKLKFNSGLPVDMLKEAQNSRYIKFYFIDSIRKYRYCRIRYKDYLNIKNIFELKKLLDLKTFDKLSKEELKKLDLKLGELKKELFYFAEKNKTRH